ncbi:hypothetical protein D1B33_09765 [Lysinibacillus yapensis]|uniref:Uncharacterized protein n=1 Tax=Ureibacillus yapensis TaxID=2304605 RepID=A0A396S745_9BACL|nr:hypothetical protein [Lysinibacillus yapensis]RHW36678.1 hypothetical protein D1B33_09765 [Lysinibacillus yapensis]
MGLSIIDYLIWLDVLVIIHLIYTECLNGKYRLLRLLINQILKVFKPNNLRLAFYYIIGTAIIIYGAATLLPSVSNINSVWGLCIAMFSFVLLLIVEKIEKKPNKRAFWIAIAFSLFIIFGFILNGLNSTVDNKLDDLLDEYNSTITIIVLGLTFIFLLTRKD